MPKFIPTKFIKWTKRWMPMPNMSTIFSSIQNFLFIIAVSIQFSNGSTLPAPPIFEAISHYPPFCYLPPESGICPENRTLPKPTGGEQNEIRAPVEDDGDGGGMPATGPLLTRFYFDSITAQCYPFGAQECGGNENRFETQAECLTKCKTY